MVNVEACVTFSLYFVKWKIQNIPFISLLWLGISEKYVVINLLSLWNQFQSHQIFHVLVIAAAFVHYHGISEMAMYRMTVGECTTQNAAAMAFWCHRVAGFAATTLENHKTLMKLIPHNYVPRQTIYLEWH